MKKANDDKYPNRLIKSKDIDEAESLADGLSFAAKEVEDAFLQNGAEPGKDYTYLDLFKLAAQLIASTSNSDTYIDPGELPFFPPFPGGAS